MAKMQGWKERFQDKKKFPRLPKQKKEPEDFNPWGAYFTPALMRITNERQERSLEEKNARKASNKNA